MRAAGRLAALVDRQRGALFPWAPVCLGIGIAWYFALRTEPAPWMLASAAGIAALLGSVARRRWGDAAGPLLAGAALVAAGLALAGARAQQVAAPVLGFRYHGPIEGRIVGIDRSASDALRLTLDRVVLENLAAVDTPERVRLSVRGDPAWLRPEVGMTVIATASLAPPEGPVAPGGYDFRRQAWFRQLGALGYASTPVLLLEPAPGGTDLWLSRLRQRLADRIRDGMPGQSGAFTATIVTGDMSGLTRQTAETLRDSNLSHILSISGLHMVLLCGTVFWVARLLLAAVPGLALRTPVGKWAALVALAAGALYYLLSGGAVPAERAWVMIAVVFGAVLADRRAISLRSLALAALVVLLMRPESLVEPGFQMSFAATLALIAVFTGQAGLLSRLPRWTRGAAATALSSAVAGAATAPLAAAHFNRLAEYGLLANLLAVPAMGLALMPLALVWILALPLGLGGPVLWLADWPARWILWVGAQVAGLPGAATPVIAPGPEVLPLLAAGGIFIALWQGRGRWAGIAPLALALLLWSRAERPDLLISSDGALLGVLASEGRALSKPKGQGFAAENWLLDDGDGASQDEAAGRPGMERGRGAVRLTLGGLRLVQITGRGVESRLPDACAEADLVVTPADVDAPPCPVWDGARFRRTGAVAVWLDAAGLRAETVAAQGAGRLWSPGEPATVQLPRRRAAADG